MKLDLSDGVILTGLAILTAGIWLIYPPAALIEMGLALVLCGVALARGR